MNDGNENLDALVNGDVAGGGVATAIEEVITTENTVTEITDTPAIRWVSPLANGLLDGGRHAPVDFTEFGRHHYRFEEIYDPEEGPTGAFAGFYKDEAVDEPVWKVLKGGLLSQEYVAANVNTFYDELAAQIDLQDEPIIHGVPFMLSVTGKTSTPINVLGDDEMKLAFEIVSGVDSNILSNANSNVDVCITNSYNGSMSIRIDFIIHIKLVGNGDHSVGFRDYFTLTHRNHRFTHTTHSLGAVSADLSRIQGHYAESVNILKNITHNIEIHAEKLSKCLKKTERGIFISFWEGIPPEHRNFLVASIIASYCLDLNYNVIQHMNMRSYIQKQMANIFASQQ